MNKFYIHGVLGNCEFSGTMQECFDHMFDNDILGTVSIMRKMRFAIIYINHNGENYHNWFRIKTNYMNKNKDNKFALQARIEIQTKWLLKYLVTLWEEDKQRAINFKNVYVDELDFYTMMVAHAKKSYKKNKSKELKRLVKYLENEFEL